MSRDRRWDPVSGEAGSAAMRRIERGRQAEAERRAAAEATIDAEDAAMAATEAGEGARGPVIDGEAEEVAAAA
jgi:molybdenum cofactor biosynthesis enzyme